MGGGGGGRGQTCSFRRPWWPCRPVGPRRWLRDGAGCGRVGPPCRAGCVGVGAGALGGWDVGTQNGLPWRLRVGGSEASLCCAASGREGAVPGPSCVPLAARDLSPSPRSVLVLAPHPVMSADVSPCLFKAEKRPQTWGTVVCHPLTCWRVALLSGPQRWVQVRWTPRG